MKYSLLKKDFGKRILSVLLVLMMLCSSLITTPLSVSAASGSPTVYSQLSDTTAYNYPGGSGSTSCFCAEQMPIIRFLLSHLLILQTQVQ